MSQCAVLCPNTAEPGSFLCTHHALLAPDGMLARWGAEKAAWEARAKANWGEASTYRIQRLGFIICANCAWGEGREVVALEFERAERLLVREMRRKAKLKRLKRAKRVPLPLLEYSGTGGQSGC